MPGGRPSSYDDSFIDKVDEYILTTGRESTELPTVEGFARYINVDSDTINNWAEAKDEEDNRIHPEFFGAIKVLKSRQREQLMNDGLYGGKEVNSTMAIFLLKANHGMIETEKRILANDVDHPLIQLDTNKDE